MRNFNWLLLLIVLVISIIQTSVRASNIVQPSGGGGFLYSSGQTAPVTQTASYVTIYTVAGVSPLSSGSCYIIDITFQDSGAGITSGQLWVDSSSVLTLFSFSTVSIQYNSLHFSYCNNVGVQNAQVVTLLPGSGYCSTTNCNAAGNWTNYNFFAVPSTPTAVDWSAGHTVAFKTNAPSGTVTGQMFRIGL